MSTTKPKAVRLQARSTKGDYPVYLITVPKAFVEQLKLEKGDILFVELAEYKGKPAIVYYRP